MSKFLKQKQPYDFEALYASWTDAPKWHGIPDRDGPVADWVAKMEAGLKSRKVPKEHWHEVASRYMGDRATKAWLFVGAATANMFGKNFSWTWKRYKKVMLLVPCRYLTFSACASQAYLAGRGEPRERPVVQASYLADQATAPGSRACSAPTAASALEAAVPKEVANHEERIEEVL